MNRFETILCEVQDGIATLTLNRPKALNAISRQMADEMTDALTQLAADPAVRVLVLRGAGDAFCAGGDVRDMATAQAAPGQRSADEALEGMARYRRMTLALHHFPRPVIAAVDGVAFGAGMSLALLADLVLLSDRARLCLVQAVRLELVAAHHVPAEQLHQLGVDEELFFAERHFAQHAQRGQVVQVARGGLALGDAFVHQVADAAIGLLKDHVHQLAGVDLGQARAHMFGGVFGQRADGGDLGRWSIWTFRPRPAA
jgi:enoyl-CoA hydratase/carnithine racemase